MTTSSYSTGTVTVTNGSTTISGTGTAWETALITGGNVFVQAIGNPMPIATVDSNTQITSELQWAGATGTYNYRIQRDTAYLKTLDTNSQNLAYLLSEMRQGTLFKYDQAGTLAGRDVFDTQSKGFSYLVIDSDNPELYVKLSATSGDWAGPFAYGTGPQGIQGPIGTLNPMGTYSAGTTYAANDNVLYNGSSFVALQATTGNAPPTLPTTETAYWSLLAIKGTDGMGTGDVVGPTGAVDGTVAAADGTTGKSIKFLTPAQVRANIGTVWEPIVAEVDLAGLSSASFALPAEFKEFELRLRDVNSTDNSAVYTRVSFDDGATYQSVADSYQFTRLQGLAPATVNFASVSAASMPLTPPGGLMVSHVNIQPGSASEFVHFWGRANSVSPSGVWETWLFDCRCVTATARATNFMLFLASGTFVTGYAQLLGRR
jgi:hypothetical protein